MSLEIRLPDLGEGIEDADVLKVLVAVGDEVQVDQPLLEIETDKATLDVPSSAAGRVTAVHVQPGATLAVGALIVTVEEVGAASSAAPASSAPPAAAPAPGAAPTPEEAPEPAPAVETPSEAPADAPSRAAESGMAVETPALPAEAPSMPASAAPAAQAAAAAPSTVPVAPSANDDGPPVFASPSVRRFAREIGIDLREVRGSGPGGRVSEDDVKRHARDSRRGATSDGGASEAAAPAAAAPSGATVAASSGAGGGRIEVPALPDFGAYGPVEREPLSRFRRTVARNMAISWSEAPHVTLHRSVDVTELEALRQRFKQRATDAGGALTVTVILLKIVAAALKANPRFNATLDLEAGELILKHYYDIGVAVDTPRGLAVPVIRGVDEKNIIELSVELTKTAERARRGDLTVEEMRGGTFTITNLGGMGVGDFSPIINWPEVAVLGVGRAEQQPVWIDGKWEPRLRMPLSLTHDHRIIDGADGARFLTWIDEAIAEPLLIALEG